MSKRMDENEKKFCDEAMNVFLLSVEGIKIKMHEDEVGSPEYQFYKDNIDAVLNFFENIKKRKNRSQ